MIGKNVVDKNLGEIWNLGIIIFSGLVILIIIILRENGGYWLV